MLPIHWVWPWRSQRPGQELFNSPPSPAPSTMRIASTKIPLPKFLVVVLGLSWHSHHLTATLPLCTIARIFTSFKRPTLLAVVRPINEVPPAIITRGLALLAQQAGSLAPPTIEQPPPAVAVAPLAADQQFVIQLAPSTPVARETSSMGSSPFLSYESPPLGGNPPLLGLSFSTCPIFGLLSAFGFPLLLSGLHLLLLPGFPLKSVPLRCRLWMDLPVPILMVLRSLQVRWRAARFRALVFPTHFMGGFHIIMGVHIPNIKASAFLLWT